MIGLGVELVVANCVTDYGFVGGVNFGHLINHLSRPLDAVSQG
jgi:hypothetical protein